VVDSDAVDLGGRALQGEALGVAARIITARSVALKGLRMVRYCRRGR